MILKMKKLIISIGILLFVFTGVEAQDFPSGVEVMNKVDANMSSENRVMSTKMIIHGRRKSRTIESKTWAVGDKQSFTEYLSPAREAGTKMLKLEDKLWMFSPSTDRTIQISGHMLRQSVMGSDLSYEDMMEDRKLEDIYTATVTSVDTIGDRACYRIELMAKVDDLAYHKQVMWVDKGRYIPLKQEMYAKSGKLLKTIELSDVEKIEGRWFPTRMVFRDNLKKGKGTEFIIDEISFDVDIPEHLFTKAMLK
jgi:outer membrane lipoprotein-sorting protein